MHDSELKMKDMSWFCGFFFFLPSLSVSIPEEGEGERERSELAGGGCWPVASNRRLTQQHYLQVKAAEWK